MLCSYGLEVADELVNKAAPTSRAPLSLRTRWMDASYDGTTGVPAWERDQAILEQDLGGGYAKASVGSWHPCLCAGRMIAAVQGPSLHTCWLDALHGGLTGVPARQRT